MSVALRLTAWYVGASFIILLTAVVALYLILARNVVRDEDEFLATKVTVLRGMLRERPGDLTALKEEVEESWAPRQYAQVYARVLQASGNVMVESPRMGARLARDAFPPAVPADAEPQQGVPLRASNGKPVRAMAASALIGKGDSLQTGVIQVALDTQTTRDLLAGYRWQLLAVLGTGLPVCAAVGYGLARQSLRPLREIAAVAQRIKSSNLDQRFDAAAFPAEISALAERFNAMLGRLQDSFSRLARFSADIAHELRTPVNNMRIEVEVALGKDRSVEEYRETLGSCLEECGRLSRIIDSLLFIARAEDPRTQIAREPVDVSRELERVRDFYEAPAAEAGVELSVSCPPQTRAQLDRTLFQRAVSNLLANAIRHTPQGGQVAVSAARENGELKVDVCDTGTGIAEEDLPHIFDRFYRADQARSNLSGGNLGLGLAIVKSIVTLHGGTIAAQSAPHSGTRMTIRVPSGAVETHI